VTATKAIEPSSRRAGRVLLLVFVLLAVGFVTAGWFYYRSYERHHRAEVEQQLSTIADLKVADIALWRRERLADGAILFKNAAFTVPLRRFLDKPADADAQRSLLDWMGNLTQYSHFDRVWLLDALGVTRLSVPAGQQPSASATLQLASKVLRSGQMAFQDFYRNERDQRVYLAVMVPILDESDTNHPLGMLVLRMDPETYLYPFLKRWPTSSRSAETLLVRREGKEVLFLNELRFQTNTALNLRAPLDRVTLPAVQAALGREGAMAGIDYRGVPVIAVARAVPDSPWALVARMDAEEAYAPMRERFWQIAAFIGALLLGAGAFVGLVWRQQSLRFYQERHQAQQAVIASEIRYRRLFEAARDGILILDAETGMVVDVNLFLIEMLSHSREAFLGKKVWELGFLKDILANEANFVQLQQQGYVRYEDLALEGSDGKRHEVEFVSNVYLVNDKKVIQCNIRDITERKRAEETIQRTLADLERSNKELEQFAYVASHDLQEPLRMVSSYTQLLAQRYENQLDDKAKKFIHYAVNGAIRMQSLIDDLLAYSRTGTRGKPLASTDSHVVLGEARRNLDLLLKENQAIITNDDLPTVRADPSQLVLVFQNLLANAIKFHRQEIPRVHVSALDQGRAWLFSFKDNGIGIEPQHAERVFVIFQRLHTREEYPGTGIGLAICKRIVERHGGKIWFESQPGNGATFFFTVPK